METDHHTEHNNGDHISVSIEDKDKKLANSIMASLHTESTLSAKCCIFRVPEILRRYNEKEFEPDVVAIGPFHRKKKSLQDMENVKKWYLNTLLSRVNTSVLRLIKGIKEFERQARECYQGPIYVDDEKNEFLEMMVIDGCFLIELFQKMKYDILQSPNDPIFYMACMHQYLSHDLLLLENQLPWFILQTLYNLTNRNDQENLPLSRLVLDFFCTSSSMINHYQSNIPQFSRENLHIVDLIRYVLVSSCPANDQSTSDDASELIPCVTSLLEAEVKFKKGSPTCMMDIKFKNGTFVIPPFSFDEHTEPMFRNLIAFEQCYSNCPNMVTSYAVLLDRLINTSKDVEYLRERGIIDNWLSAEDASKFFNRLYVDTSVVDFYYEELCKRVNRYHLTKWHRWRATLMRNYFTTPWTVISLVAAFILLVLTFLQTLYSIKQS